MYDAIVVGARVAGSATAMLLARQGLRVLAVDRAGFPSDTLSTHQIQLPGVALLRRWGLLDRVLAASGAPPTRQVPVRSMACYSYWERVPLDGGEVYSRDRRAVGAWPTSDGLTMIYVAWPVGDFAAVRTDIEGNLLATLDAVGDLGERVRAGRRVERIGSARTCRR